MTELSREELLQFRTGATKIGCGVNELSKEQQIEVDFWKTSPTENPDANTLDNILHKCAEARLFLREMRMYSRFFAQASVVLELGAGQAWASAIVKREFPQVVAYASDISPYAVRSVAKWEYVFRSKVDQVFPCPSNEIPLEDNSVDLVFCFQAAHHFRAHRKTLMEIKRVLRNGGTGLYLQEPCCPQLWYPLANWRVNHKRPEVPEDVIVHRKLVAIAEQVGFLASYELVPHTMNKAPIETIYYFLLTKIKPLQYFLPCAADFVFRKM